MDEHDQIYGDDRARRLRELLRAIAARIVELDAEGRLLAAAPELIRLMGDARTELFHHEVRSTYDTPEVAESRRIVEEAKRDDDPLHDDTEDDEPWRQRPEE
jgi:PAS domain-containing protein